MKSSFYCALFFLFSFSTNVSAVGSPLMGQWEKIPVPGAVCGDGAPYSMYFRKGNPEKVALYFMGGGACWSLDTCVGPTPLTNIFEIIPLDQAGGILSTDQTKSPIFDYSVAYFPYCTGDVFLGQHTVEYAPGVTVHHQGIDQVKRSLQVIADQKIMDLPASREVVLYGVSAGAIALMYHIQSVKDILGPPHAGQKRIMIADAPGLHFGSKFWDKFSDEYVADFSDALSHVGRSVEHGEGNLSWIVPRVCAKHPDFKIGILQGSRDWVMSRLFGDISMRDHEALVYGDKGVFEETLNGSDNCSAWVPQTMEHTFLGTDITSEFKTSDGTNARDFSFQLVLGNGKRNYK
ncbi:pectin acetylesterase-family hydrolase [Bdellovibrionota bacterium FG-2]